MERVPAAAREAIAVALSAVEPAAADRARRRLFPAAWTPPPGAALRGISRTVRLRRVVLGGDGVFAVDGNEVVRLAARARTIVTPIAREAPMAMAGDRLLILFGGTIRVYAPDGALLDARPAAGSLDLAEAQRIMASWSADAPAGSVAVTPSEEERAAFEALAHAGAPPPPAAAWVGRAFVEPRAVLRVAPGGALERTSLPGEVGAWCAGPRGLALAVHDGDTMRIAWIEARGGAVLSEALTLPRADVRQILAGEASAWLRVTAGPGEALLEIARG
jgi:hypothetical protein